MDASTMDWTGEVIWEITIDRGRHVSVYAGKDEGSFTKLNELDITSSTRWGSEPVEYLDFEPFEEPVITQYKYEERK